MMERCGVPYTSRKMEAFTMTQKLTGTNKTIIACTALVAGAAVEVFALLSGMKPGPLAYSDRSPVSPSAVYLSNPGHQNDLARENPEMV